MLRPHSVVTSEHRTFQGKHMKRHRCSLCLTDQQGQWGTERSNSSPGPLTGGGMENPWRVG